MSWGQKKISVIHESRKSYQKRRINWFIIGLLVALLLIAIVIKYLFFLILIAVIGLALFAAWKRLSKGSRR